MQDMMYLSVDPDGVFKDYRLTVTKDNGQSWIYYPKIKVGDWNSEQCWGEWRSLEVQKPKILLKRFETFNVNYPDIDCDSCTVCYLETDMGLAVGFALHWTRDKNDDPKLARHIAFERAKIAVDTQKSSRVIRKKTYMGLRKFGIFALSNWIG